MTGEYSYDGKTQAWREVLVFSISESVAAGDAVGKMPISSERRDLAAWIAPVKQGSPLYGHLWL
jgi:hypothetical protein